MDFLTDFNKIFGRKIISYFIWIYIYCFLFSLNSNIFICSYLKLGLFNVENNFYILFIFFTLFVMYSYYFKQNYKNNFNIYNYINLKYILFFYKKQSISILFNLLFNKLTTLFNNIIILYKNNLIVTFICYVSQIIKNSILIWYPIYKSYSIFGYYKSTRLKFIDLKNENLKRFKY